MPLLLHILTKPDDALAQEIIAQQRQQPENQLEVVALTGEKPDYQALVKKIFAADSVAVW